MAQAHPDPAAQWSGHLTRLDDVRRDAVVMALRHSASTGWPASETGVELLVAYALGEITAGQYASGLLRSWGIGPAGEAPRPSPEPSPVPAPEPAGDADPGRTDIVAARPGRRRREEVVQAYVTGQIDVAEFLRLARS